MLYVSDTQNYKRKLLEIISDFSKVAEFIARLQKLVTFLYMYQHRHAEKDHGDTPTQENLVINLTKEVKDLQLKLYLWRNWGMHEKIGRPPMLFRIIIKKKSILTETTCRFNAVPAKTPTTYFRDRQKYPKTHMNPQSPWVAKATQSQEKNSAGRISTWNLWRILLSNSHKKHGPGTKTVM